MRFADPVNSNQHIFIMKSLLDQLKSRRIKPGLKQYDLRLRASNTSVSNPGRNPRLDTLELVTRGLHSEILLIPQEKLQAVKAVLKDKTVDTLASRAERENRLSDDPWRGTPGDDE